MRTVSFTSMERGTAEGYHYLDTLEDQYKPALAGRLIEVLGKREGLLCGYRFFRLEHCLQGATRAYRAVSQKK